MTDINQEVTNEATENERTFTQSELDAIVTERLRRDRAKYADYDELKAKAEKYDEAAEAEKSELQKATELAQSLQTELDGLKKYNEVRALREKVAEETGVPARLLSAETEEDMQAQAKAIIEFANPRSYPTVQDSGEVQHPVGRMSTRQQFAEWADKAFNS